MAVVYSLDSIEMIIDKYIDMVFRIAFIHCGTKQDAEDIVQDVFLCLFEKHPEFQSIEHCKSWLIRVTINRCCDQSRYYSHRKHLHLDDSFRLCDSVSEVEKIENNDNTLRQLMLLPVKMRRDVVLHYIYGYSLVEIAKITGSSKSAVATRLYRARQALRLEERKNIT